MKIISKYFILILYCYFLLLSCSDNENNSINLKDLQNEKLEISNSYNIIQLESKPESLLGFLLKVNIDIPNDRIFVLSNFNLYIFNSKGNFINKLKVGGGPGEITRVLSFAINNQKRIIYINDNSIKLGSYDYNGNLINNYNLNGYFCNDIYVQNNNHIFLLCNGVGYKEKYFVAKYDLSKQKVIKKFVSAQESPYPKFSIVMDNNFTCYGEKIFFYSPNIFGMFEYRNNDFRKIFSIDLGKESVPKSLPEKYRDGHNCDLQDEAKSRNLTPFLLAAFPFKGYYFIITDDAKTNCYALNMQNHKIFNNGNLSSYFNIPDKKSLRFPCGIQDNFIILQYNPIDFFEYEKSDKLKEIHIAGQKIKIQQNDNPFLVIVQ